MSHDPSRELSDATICAYGTRAHKHGALALPIHLSSAYRFASTASDLKADLSQALAAI